MKTLYTVLKTAVLLLSLNLSAQEKNSYVSINGTTNVNSFKCVNNSFHQAVPLSLNHSNDNKFAETSINLIVNDFDCRNRIMTHDFRDILHAEKYPFLNITFLSLDKKDHNSYKAFVQVKMMNKVKKYSLDLILKDSALVGNKTLRFSEFDIVPPKKFGGMVSVKDDLNLAVSLKVKH
ncbi:hypothetical protein [Cloacibacterium sp. TD35]|uniref:hypothetical protein n=1 Tax=Cloacibacterium sp. TD35 TaxID=2976818 RepID=UPI00237E357B|nr:hypothetical protein [Cloacibacterium sp. TD35]WDT66951.1 hypothetical protein N7277_06295 [Cloacibacterium sp. TD35]